MFKIKQKLKGFTLIETILYLAIVGILLSAIIDFSITLGNSSSKMSANIDVSRNRRFALDTINYLLRNADGLWKDVYNNDCSNFNSSPQILALYFSSDAYLPGTCVVNGGGVKISLDSGQVKMTCYPNAGYNGSYNTCATAAGNSYFLTSPEVAVTNSNLVFATSTATSTANGFTSVTTYLNVNNISNDQVSLKASSAATSTVALRNEQANGLIAFYKFNDAVGTSAVDSIDGTSLTCSGPSTAANLVNGSGGAFDFSTPDYCYINNPEKLNLGNSFTISVWLKQITEADSEHSIISKWNGSNKGYYLYQNESGGEVIFTLCDGASCTPILDEVGILEFGIVYNVTVVYDQTRGWGKMYIYKKGVGGVSTTTASSWPILVNDDTADFPTIGQNFDGSLDDLRIYNRALSETEVWALQSQGY